jgi:hypothetical protein
VEAILDLQSAQKINTLQGTIHRLLKHSWGSEKVVVSASLKKLKVSIEHGCPHLQLKQQGHNCRNIKRSINPI